MSLFMAALAFFGGVEALPQEGCIEIGHHEHEDPDLFFELPLNNILYPVPRTAFYKKGNLFDRLPIGLFLSYVHES